MNVEELIQALSQYPKDRKVLIRGYENGLDGLVATKEVAIVPHQGAWYEGSYKATPAGNEKAVYLIEEEKDADEFDCE